MLDKSWKLPERGKIAGLPEEGSNVGPTRNIPKNHGFDHRSLKPLAKTLWAATVALGHALTAQKHLSRIKSATVSPDGSLGGRGYVMSLSEMRKKLAEATETLSSITDTIFDEINAPHWKPKLAELDPADQEDVTRFVDEAREVMDDPEKDADDEIDEIESENDSEDPKIKKASAGIPAGYGVDRVKDIGPGAAPGYFGEYNTDTFLQDELGDTGAYNIYAFSETPGASNDDAAMDADDYGLGYGATGKGLSHGISAPSGTLTPAKKPGSKLPLDKERPVSRSDYYKGPKDNDYSVYATAEIPSLESAPSGDSNGVSVTQIDLNNDYRLYNDFPGRPERSPREHTEQTYLEPFALEANYEE